MTAPLPPAWNLTIPDDIALAVGRFLAATSLMDYALQAVIWHLLGNRPADLRPITWNLGVVTKRDIITNLLSRRTIDPAKLGAWNKAKPLVKEVNENRNWVAHGFWWDVPAGYIRAHKGTVGTFKPIKLQDIEDWTEKAKDAIALVICLLP
jgi:hypothetical protein